MDDSLRVGRMCLPILSAEQESDLPPAGPVPGAPEELQGEGQSSEGETTTQDGRVRVEMQWCRYREDYSVLCPCPAQSHPQSPLQDPAHAAAFEAQASELAKRVNENDNLQREVTGRCSLWWQWWWLCQDWGVT